jgi:pentatricopeptide repeat protein
MRVMVLVKANKDSEAGKMPSEQGLTNMMKFNEELVKAGIMLAGEGLHPTSTAKRVRFNGKERVVLDGPFTETKELVAGFWLWQVRSMDEAVEWLKRMPQEEGVEPNEVEVRRVFEAEDFGENLTPETRAKEAELRGLVSTQRN